MSTLLSDWRVWIGSVLFVAAIVVLRGEGRAISPTWERLIFLNDSYPAAATPVVNSIAVRRYLATSVSLIRVS